VQRNFTFKVTILDPGGEEHTFYRNVEGNGFVDALHACINEIEFAYTPDKLEIMPVTFGMNRAYVKSKMCGTKHCYATQQIAEQIADKLNITAKRKGKIAGAYRCRFCQFWHVGNRDA